MNVRLLSSVLGIALSVFLIVKNSIQFDPVRFTCTNYIFNTYLYLFLCVCIVASLLFSLEAYQIQPSALFSGWKRFVLLCAFLVVVFFLFSMSPKQFATKHLLYITFLCFCAVMLYPLFLQNQAVFYHAGLTTALILIVLSCTAFYFQDYISLSWMKYLMFGLVALLIALFCEAILSYTQVIQKNTSSTLNRMLSYGIIVLFSGFILYDTKTVIVNAQNCVNPDYINQSLDLFVDSFNILTALTRSGQ